MHKEYKSFCDIEHAMLIHDKLEAITDEIKRGRHEGCLEKLAEVQVDMAMLIGYLKGEEANFEKVKECVHECLHHMRGAMASMKDMKSSKY